jgi:hypothetical protein
MPEIVKKGPHLIDFCPIGKQVAGYLLNVA